MKKLLTIILAALPIMAFAQEQLNVTVDSVGQLETKIEESIRTKLSELKISGPLNGKDIKLLQEIVNRTKISKKKGECAVTTIDLSEATIETGKDRTKIKLRRSAVRSVDVYAAEKRGDNKKADAPKNDKKDSEAAE